MIFVYIVIACVASVPLAGGRLMALLDLNVRCAWLAGAGLLAQIVVINIVPHGSPTVHSVVHISSYVMAGTFLLANRRIPGIGLLALGGGLNVAAITANGGVMPASTSALASAGIIHHAGTYANSAAVGHAHLAWLGDVFAIPSSLPLPNVFSIGDVLIVLGVLVLVHRGAQSRLGAHPLVDRAFSSAPAATAEAAFAMAPLVLALLVGLTVVTGVGPLGSGWIAALMATALATTFLRVRWAREHQAELARVYARQRERRGF